MTKGLAVDFNADSIFLTDKFEKTESFKYNQKCQLKIKKLIKINRLSFILSQLTFAVSQIPL